MEEWDSIAESWNRTRKRPLKEAYYFASLLKGLGPSSIAIGIGEGNGRNMKPFSDMGLKVLNIDMSAEMLRYSGMLSAKAGMDALPIRDRSTDVVISLNAIHCLGSSEKRKKALEEMRRVVKTGGLLLISAWNRFEKRFLPASIRDPDVVVPWRADKCVIERHYHLFTKHELELLVSNAGFSILESFKGWNSKESWFVIGKAV